MTGISTGLTVGFSNSLGISFGGSVGVGFNVASFEDQVTNGTNNETTITNSNTVTDTVTSTITAGYSITGPQLSDNYSGPATYNVYLDNIYGTYAFYSDLEPQVNLGSIDVTTLISPSTGAPVPACPPKYANQPFSTCQTINSTANLTPLQPIPVMGPATISSQNTASSPSTAPGLIYPVTLINHSNYPLTMVYPAVTFSDPGFVLVEGSSSYPDTCSNQYLLPYGQTNPSQTQSYYCTLFVTFQPQWSDAPNPITLANRASVQATMVAAGTENASSFQNILVTSQSPVAGVVSGATQGATLIAIDSSISQYNPLPNVYTFGTTSYGGSSAPETFIFTNNYSVPLTLASTPVMLSDATDFMLGNGTGSSVNGGCTPGSQVPVSGSCSFSIRYTPALLTSNSGVIYPATSIDILGSIGSSGSQSVLALAGAIGGASQVPIATSPASMTDQLPLNCPATSSVGSSSASSYDCTEIGTTITVTNNTGTVLNSFHITINGATGQHYYIDESSGTSCYTKTSLAVNGYCTIDAEVDAGYSTTCNNTCTASSYYNGALSGTFVITAIRQGDSVQVQATVPVEIYADAPALDGDEQFVFAPVSAAPNQTVAAGAVAQFSLAISPTGKAYPSQVTFAATGLPTGATASFSPSTLAANAGAQNVMMSVQTPANLVDNAPSNIKPHGPAVYLGWLVLPLAGFFRARRRRKGILRLMSVLILLVAGGWAAIGVSGCSSGGGGTAGTTTVVTHTYAITVTATSAGVSQSTSVILNIQ